MKIHRIVSWLTALCLLLAQLAAVQHVVAHDLASALEHHDHNHVALLRLDRQSGFQAVLHKHSHSDDTQDCAAFHAFVNVPAHVGWQTIGCAWMVYENHSLRSEVATDTVARPWLSIPIRAPPESRDV